MVIRRFFKDGSFDEVESVSLKAFKKSSVGKDPNMLVCAIIDAVTKVVIALIRVKKDRLAKSLPVKEKTVK